MVRRSAVGEFGAGLAGALRGGESVLLAMNTLWNDATGPH